MIARNRPASLLLKYLTGRLQGQLCLIEAPGASIGRDASNGIVLADEPSLAPRHARVFWGEAGWCVENLSDTSFIMVDGSRVDQAPLAVGTTIGLGDAIALSVLFAAAAEAGAVPADSLATAALVAPAAPSSRPAPSPQPARPAASAPARAATPVPAAPAPAPPSDPQATVAADAPNLAGPALRADATQAAPFDAVGLPWLEIKRNTRAEKTAYLLASPVINVGSDPDNEIVLDDPLVSAHHLQLVRRGQTFVLTHPHPAGGATRYGLLHRGREIAGAEAFTKVLSEGDFFRIGDEHGTLITLTYHDGTGAPATATPTMKPTRLGAPALMIGRQPDNDVVLDHPQVSGYHARLLREGAAYRVLNLSRTNQIYVNGEVATNRLLETGDEIRIGPFRLVYEGNQLAQYDERNFIRVDALNLHTFGTNRVTLLNGITLAVPPRAFVAVVGGSGAGKSTLMNALNGMRPADSGSVLYNGQDYYQSMSAFSAHIGYVPQDDIVHRDLTVERALYYAAKLRLPSDYSDEQVEQRIVEVLEKVELTPRRGLMIRDLSGGQRKRVSIALELLANPSIFFLDEPTSGLDPGLDRKMMLLLRKLADHGHTIVLVTHATTNINACDYVCFLCAGGRLAYFGPPEQARVYFGKTDFAEIYSLLEPTEDHPEIPAAAEARFKASADYQQYVLQPLDARGVVASTPAVGSAAVANGHGAAQSASPAAPTEAPAPMPKRARRRNAWAQFLTLSLRYLESLKNDPINLLILLLQAPVIAILLVLMLRFELGAGIFNRDTLVQCRTQIITASGPLALPQAQHAVLTSCQQVLNFLRTAPAGQAYARQHGGVAQALQNFITPGPGIDAQKALFNLAFATIVFGCLNGAREFVKEAPIFRRERAVNLGILPYMFSKIAVLGLLCLLQTAVLTLVVQLGEPFQQGIVLPPLLEVYITLVLTALAGLMVGLAISAMAPNADRALSFVPIILIPQVIFSGAIIPLKDWLTQIVATIFPVRWSMAALGSSMGLHADAVGGDHLFGSDPTYHGTLYSVYTQTDALHRLLLSWGALGATIVVLAVVIGIFLKRKDSQA